MAREDPGAPSPDADAAPEGFEETMRGEAEQAGEAPPQDAGAQSPRTRERKPGEYQPV
jgi:hypothetical protein